MTIALTAFSAQLDALVQDITAAEASAAEKYRHVRAAVEQYSRDLPDEVTEDESGDGGRYYGIAALLGSWSEGFSRIEQIEYPAATIASDEVPVYLEREDWRDDYWAASLRYLYLPNHAPAATETMRITYTAPYSWAASSTTTAVAQTAHGLSVDDLVYLSGSDYVEATDPQLATHIVTAVADVDNFTAAGLVVDPPPAHFFGICYLAASIACRAIAAKYSRTSDSSVTADSVNHTSRATEFAARAKQFYEMYLAAVGLGGAADAQANIPAAGDFVDWDTAPGWPSGRQYVFHRNR